MSTPTLRGTTAAGTGATYIPVDRFQQELTVQVIANGTVTFTVDYTGDNVLYVTAAQVAANLQGRKDLVDPGSAAWTNLIASGSANAAATTEARARCVRINITAGTGSVTYTINQGGS